MTPDFYHPGFLSPRFERRGHWLYFRWDAQDSREAGKLAHLGTLADPDRFPSMEEAAWFCVRLAALHEAGEWFTVNGQRPYDPHTTDWWWDAYTEGGAPRSEPRA